jgi:hypothetical protein
VGELRGVAHMVADTLFGSSTVEQSWRRPQFIRLSGRVLRPTAVFDTYWRFAVSRQAIYLGRLRRAPLPWTDDAVLQVHRFTNVFRAADRVSQFLISDVQRGPTASLEPIDVVFRTLLFKIFNRPDTWQRLERSVGPVTWRDYDYARYRAALDEAAAAGPIYSPAYVMPPPRLGEDRKHANHLRLLEHMMRDGLAEKVCSAASLKVIFDALLSYAGIGPFLAYQFTIDINYSDLVSFDENDFVAAGPGARDGIRKCFGRDASGVESEIIRYVVEFQDVYFDRLGLDFPGLFGRPLHLIDAQNLFCEVDKYARVRHPEIPGISGRSRIKQRYSPGPPVATPSFPRRWNLDSSVAESLSCMQHGDCPGIEVDRDGAAPVVSQMPPGRVAREDCQLPF